MGKSLCSFVCMKVILADSLGVYAVVQVIFILTFCSTTPAADGALRTSTSHFSYSRKYLLLCA